MAKATTWKDVPVGTRVKHRDLFHQDGTPLPNMTGTVTDIVYVFVEWDGQIREPAGGLFDDPPVPTSHGRYPPEFLLPVAGTS